MNLKTLKDLPPWEWPEDAGETLLKILGDGRADQADRLLATELAGDYAVIDDEIANALLAIVSDSREADELRGQAAISLGPALEGADMFGFVDDCPDGFADELDTPISEETFIRIKAALSQIYNNDQAPKEVRRRVLEASARAPEEWHEAAIQAAYASSDKDWRLTAVFCMRFVGGFDVEILESLKTKDPDLLREAVIAAGNGELDEAWPAIAAILKSPTTPKPLLLAAIEAAAGVSPEKASLVLDKFAASDDDDIADAAYEAMGMAEGLAGDEDEDLFD